MCSLGYCHAFLLSTAGVDGLFQSIHTSGRQQESMTMPKAAHTKLLMMGEKTARNM
jgi:uroporphyrinogen-III synthase